MRAKARAAIKVDEHHDWFTLEKAQPQGRVTKLSGPWSKNIDSEKAEIYLHTSLASPSKDQSAASRGGKPFFLYFALTAPHTPTSPSPNFEGKSKLGLYGDFVMETDHCIGRILAALEKHFRYPLSPTLSFQLDHGDDYTAFFRAMGDAVEGAGGRLFGSLLGSSWAVRRVARRRDRRGSFRSGHPPHSRRRD